MAGNQEIIDEIIDPVAKKQVTDLQKLLADLDIQFVATAKNATALNNVTANAKGFSDFNDKATKSEVALKKLQAEHNKTAITANNLEKSNIALSTAQQRQIAQQERAAQAAQKALSPYAQLSKELDKLRAHAKDVGAEFGTNSEKFKSAARPVQELDERLKGIDQTLGQSQRNVGNYGNAFRGVIAQSIPFGDATLRVGENLKTLGLDFEETTAKLGTMATGFLSFTTTAFVVAIASAAYYLSQFRSTGHEIEKFISGLKAQFGDLGESIVTGLKEFSFKEKIKNFFNIVPGIGAGEFKEKGKEAGKGFAESFQSGVEEKAEEITLANLTEIATNSIAANSAEAEKFRALAADRKLDITDRIKYIKAAQDLEKENLQIQKDNSQETINTAIRLGDKFGKLSYDQAKQLERGDLQLAQDLAEQGQLFTSEGFELYKKGIEKKIAFQQSSAAHILQLQADADNMQLKADRALAKAQDRLDKARLEGELDKAKLIINNDDKNYDSKLKANEIFVAKSLKLLDLEKKNKLESANIPSKAGADSRTEAVTRLAIEQEYQNSRNKILDEGQKQRQALDKAETERQKKNLQELLAANKGLETLTISNLQDASNKRLTVIEDEFDKEAALLDGKFAKNKLNEMEYNRELLKIQDQYNIDRLGEEVFLQQSILEVKEAALKDDLELAKNRGASPDEVRDLTNKSGVSQQQNVVAKAGTALNKAVNTQSKDQAKSDNEKLREFQKEFSQDAQQLAKATEIAQQAEDAHYQHQIDLLEEKKQLIDDTAKAQIDGVNNSILSEADKARKINTINAQSAQQKAKIDAQEKKAKTDQARFDREAGVAKIIINTAVAVVEALPNVVLAAVVGALGAAELAVAVATPLPKFATGTLNAPEGYAHVGERGPELRIDPSGQMSLTPGTDTITYLQKGTQIIPNHMIRPDKLNYTGGQQVPWREVLSELRKNRPETQKRPVVRIQVNNDSLVKQMSR